MRERSPRSSAAKRDDEPSTRGSVADANHSGVHSSLLVSIAQPLLCAQECSNARASPNLGRLWLHGNNHSSQLPAERRLFGLGRRHKHQLHHDFLALYVLTRSSAYTDGVNAESQWTVPSRLLAIVEGLRSYLLVTCMLSEVDPGTETFEHTTSMNTYSTFLAYLTFSKA